MACRFAIWPTNRSPPSVIATMEGVVLEPSLLGMTTASPPSITATQEFVVPRSIPITLPMMLPTRSWLAVALRFVGDPHRLGARRRSGDNDRGRPDEPVVHEEAALLLVYHHPRRPVAARDAHERLVHAGIEW